MQLKVIGSGSAGNAYLLEDDNCALLIELGVKFSSIKKELDFDFSKVAGALVSHSHGDHFKSVKHALAAGIEVYTGSKTIDDSGIEDHNLNTIDPGKAKMIGPFKVASFELKHDVPCLGFIINHPDTGSICFITDTYYSPWKFKNISNWLVECNYSEEILDKRMDLGDTQQFLRNRILSSHMSLENCLSLFEANDLSMTNNIVLTHLSDGNSHARQFQKKVEDQTGKTVTIAENGITINLNKRPF